MLSMTCQNTLISHSSLKYLAPSPVPNCFAYSCNTVLPLIPCLSSSSFPCSVTETFPADSTLSTSAPPLRLWTELHHRLLCWVNAPLDSRSASAVHDAQEVHNECLLNEGSIRFPISAVCEVKRGQNEFMTLHLSVIN